MNLGREVREDLHLIYTTSVEDIRFAKQQQWRLVYYALLLMTGIFYIKLSNELQIFWHITLIIITVAIAIFAVYIIIAIEDDIRGYRSRMLQVENRLSNEFKDITQIDEDKLAYSEFKIFKRSVKIPRYKREYLLIQIIAILLAMAVFIFLA